jgi:dTDP-4-amino-4,6-dideoxygalactose transaminase
VVIPFLDLRAQYHSIKSEVDAAVLAVLESAHFVLGEEVDAFEREFAARCDTAYGIALNSGTSALHLALLAIGAGPGDEVITTPFTFVATVAAILYTGAQPVFVDVDPNTLTLDPNLIRGAITPRTKAILPVHLHGRPADMDGIMSVAREANLRVIEDAAQAHLATFGDRPIGSIGDLACFSFYPGKNLGAYGEGGLVTTSNAEYAETIRMLRDWGQRGKYNHVMKGYNYRMEAVQGAVLRVKLRHLQGWTEARRRHARTYDELLAGSAVQAPAATPGHVYHVYAVQSRNRDRLQAHLKERDIQTGIHYPFPVHLLEAYRDLGYPPGSFPHSEQAAREVLSLPLYPEMTAEQIDVVSAAVQAFRD